MCVLEPALHVVPGLLLLLLLLLAIKQYRVRVCVRRCKEGWSDTATVMSSAWEMRRANVPANGRPRRSWQFSVRPTAAAVRFIIVARFGAVALWRAAPDGWMENEAACGPSVAGRSSIFVAVHCVVVIFRAT